MIRQARTYFVGAMSGATLIAIAIAVFAVLVSTQVFGDWPIAGLVGGGKEAAVSIAQPVAEVGTAGAGGTEAAGGQAAAGAGGSGANGGRNPQGAGGNAAAPGDNGAGGGGGEGPAGGGGGEGGGAGGGAGGGGSTTPGGGGGGGATGSGSGGGSSGGSTSSPSGQAAGTVNETVHKVDETVTGGALEESGVTGATEEAVNGVVGSESPVGKVVDETVGVVNGIVGGK